MAPFIKSLPTEINVKTENATPPSTVSIDTQTEEKYKRTIVWKNIVIFFYFHVIALYGIYLCLQPSNWRMWIYTFLMSYLTGFGITAGAHRLWSHRSYKAKLPLRVILVILNTLAFQNSVIEWARDHRVHHKYSETDADPHNSNRGFFFAHMGWLLCRKHPNVKSKGKGVDLSDLFGDPILAFQHKHYLPLMVLVCFVIPTLIPMYFWNESFITSFSINMLRYIFTLHATWLINSVAHIYGQKPFDKSISPVENKLVSICALGEGWHNYHHTFPWDYKTSELGKYSRNLTTAFIDFFAFIGWAYDLKTTSVEMIKTRVQRTGDGSHKVWGWGDKDQSKEDYSDATIIKKLE